MPSSDAIVWNATMIANEWRTVAVAWHVMLVLALIAVSFGWRPSSRGAATILAAPFLSVSAAAWSGGNPVNGTVFAALFLVLLRVSERLPASRVRFGASKFAVPGALLVAFGAAYPHFLTTTSWITYAYAAPLGVLPCPTLSAVIGAALLCGLFSAAPWSVALVIASLVYGAMGVLMLGVQLDYGLLAGALLLLGALLSSTSAFRCRHSASALHRGNAS